MPGVSLTKAPKSLMPTTSPSKILAHLGLFHDAQDHGLGGLAGRAVDGGDVDGAVLLDVDGRAGLLLDAAHDLAAGADDVADLVDGDVDGLDARGGVAQLLRAARADRSSMAFRMKRTAFVGLLERAGQDVDGQALGLVVHLQGGDALLGAADLEVHVAEEVLDALDVGEDDDVVAFLDEAHRRCRRPGALMGTPASIRASVEPQVEAMEDEPLDSRTSETTRMA